MNKKQIDILKQNLTIKDGQPVTTSLKVAESFDKRHDHVLRDIDELECTPSFHLSNFGEMAHFRPNPLTGGQTESRAFEMTKKGFMFLALAYKGQKAAVLREAYIEAFEQMEAELSSGMAVTRAQMADAMLSLMADAGDRGYDALFLPTLVQCRRSGLSCEQTGRVLQISGSAVSVWHRKLVAAGIELPDGGTRAAAATYFRQLTTGMRSQHDTGEDAQLPLFAEVAR